MIENLLLGDSRALRLDVAGARQRLEEFSAMLGVQIDPDARARDLALGGQQQVEIIKALWRGSRVLILDEPTSMLTPQAVRELQSVLERLTRARAGDRLHHPQAARGRRARRPHLGPARRPPDRRDRP